MEALVIYESMFGNTRKIAEAIAAGLSDSAHATVADVLDAPTEVPPQVDVVVLGGPTHVFSMSRVSTRQSAVQRGAAGTDLGGGIREWLEGLSHGGHPQAFAGFDTRVDLPLLPGAASRAATRVAQRLGFTVTEPESFLVEGYEGPLLPGELERAHAWGQRLALQFADA